MASTFRILSLSAQMLTNPDGAPRAEPPAFQTDVLQIFADSPAESDDDGSRGPTSGDLEKRWRVVVVDAVTVHLKKDTEINIMIPVADELLLPDWKWSLSKPQPGHPMDPTWLV